MLRLAMKTAIGQSYEDMEIIIVDDGSEPPVKSVVDEFNSQNLVYLRLNENQGANVARNAGIEHSTGEYIAFLDDDDQWKREKIALQVDKFEKNPSVGVVYTGQEFINEDGKTTLKKTPNASGNITRYLLEGGEMTTFSCLMVRKSIIDDAGKPEPELPILQDREWPIRLSMYTRFYPIDDVLVSRQIGDYESIGDNYNALRDVAAPYIYNKYRDLAVKEGISVQLKFQSWMFETIGKSALSNKNYSDARKYLLLALLYWPFSADILLSFIASIGGQYTHNIATNIRRL